MVALILYEQKKFAEVKQYFDRTKFEGDDDPIVFGVAMMLGRSMHMLQDYVGAEQQLRNVVRISSALYGTKHRSTSQSEYHLAVTLYEQKKFVEAGQLLEQAVPKLEEGLGPEHRTQSIVRIFYRMSNSPKNPQEHKLHSRMLFSIATQIFSLKVSSGTLSITSQRFSKSRFF
jgi:TolA-binding protein